MTKTERYRHIIDYFQRTMPHAETELHFADNYQLIVAVMLSAQCTDRRVNLVTPALFERFPTIESLAAASFDDLFPFVRSVSYPNSKTTHLIAMARKVLSDFGGVIPSTTDELTTLPGVGRKTANVVQCVAFGKSTMPVDTHVFRVSHRLGLVPDSCTTPLSVEKELLKNIPSELIPLAHHWLILHGRYTCKALRPQCSECGLREWCKNKKE